MSSHRIYRILKGFRERLAFQGSLTITQNFTLSEKDILIFMSEYL